MMNVLNIIVEEVKKFLNEYEKTYTIRDLVELTTRMGYEYDTMLKIFQDMYQRGGDDFVIETFNEITDINIHSISKGRYTFTEPVGGS